MFLFNARHILKNQQNIGSLLTDKEFFFKTVKVAWPAALESFLVALVSFVDTMMVSSLGAYAIASIGLVNQPRFICLSIFFALNVATSALVARRKGANRQDEANQVLIQTLLIAIILAIVITALALIFSDSVIQLVGSQADTHPYAVSYFRIIISGLILQVLSMTINAAQRGAGKTKVSMRANLTMSGVNIIFNFLLIEGRFGFPALGVNGAAIASLLGFMAGTIMSVLSVLKKTGYLYLFFKNNSLRPRCDIYRNVFKVGSGSFAEQIFLRIGFLLYALIVANLGTTALAAHQIGMTIITISFAIGDGLSVAGVALVGQSLGQKRPDLAKIYGGFCQHLGIICSLIIATVYSILGTQIYTLFSSEIPILDYGSVIMPIIGLIVILQIAQVIFGGCLRGAGDTRYTAFISLISVAVIRPFSAWLFVYPLKMGLLGAWYSLLLDQAIRYVLTRHRFKSGKWQKIEI